MGLPGPVSTPHLPRDRTLPVLASMALGLALALILLSSSGLAEDGPRTRPAWASLELAQDQPQIVDVDGDIAVFHLEAAWSGLLAGEVPVLIVEPMPEGWSYRVPDAIRKPHGFSVPENGTIGLEVTIDDDTEAGTYYLEPRLDHPSEVLTLASLPISVDVTPYQIVMGIAYFSDSVVGPGDCADMELTVRAAANVQRLMDIRVDFAPKGWDVVVHKEMVVVSDGEAEGIPVSVNTSSFALPGEYAIIISARTDDPRSTPGTIEVHLAVKALPLLKFQSFPAAMEAPLGGEDTVDFVIENRGNVATQAIAISPYGEHPPPEGWSISYVGLPALIPPYGHQEVEVTVHVPEDPGMAPAGETDLSFRVLTGQSSTDLPLTLRVLVEEDRRLELEVEPDANASAPSSRWVQSSGSFIVVMWVRDAGNLRDVREVTMSAIFDPPVTEVHFSTDRLHLGPGMEAWLGLEAFLQPPVAPGTYNVTVVADDGMGGQASTAVDLVVPNAKATILPQYSVSEVEDASYMTSQSTSLYRLYGQVMNDGSDDLDYAELVLYEGSSQGSKQMGYMPLENLTAGEVRNFAFTFDSEDSYHLSVEATVTVGDSTITDPVQFDYHAIPPPSADAGDSAMGTAISAEDWEVLLTFVLGVAVGGLAGVIAILGTEAGRFALMAFLLVPLYTRLKPEQVENQFVRGQILGYVKANPGETYSSIRKALSLSNGQFVYHARILETQGLIKSIKDGANRRFYPADMRIPKEVKDVKLNQVQRIIYTIILEYPGISQSKIAKMMKLAPSTVNYHVNIMTKVGVVERRRSGRLSLCFASDETN